MAAQPLRTLLAMPASLRPLLLTVSSASSSVPEMRRLQTPCRFYASYRSMRHPLTVGAFTVPHSPVLPLSEIPIETLLESPNPDKSLSDDLTSLFTRNPATFYHGTHDFYTLKKNTQIPEICILGRSNVGKSTFVNALANRLHRELAHTSSKAGKTKAMNAFGFGPVPLAKDLAETDAETKRTEDMPKHTFFVVDMPGYGYKSLKDWGRNISLYLTKRQAVKGAILLIDGEVGPKKGDMQVLEILEKAGLRTAIVLTKADKAKDEEMLRKTCRDMWLTMRDITGRDPNSTWTYEKDFFVTALGATKKDIGVDSVTIARLAVARLAGLVEEKRRPEHEAAKGYSGKVVSFDELQYVSKSSSDAPNESRTATSTQDYSMERVNYSLTALEQAAIDLHKSRTSASRVSTTSGLRNANSRRVQTRCYHKPAKQHTSTTDSKEFHKILKDFTARLVSAPTPLDRARNAQASLQRIKPKKVWDPTRVFQRFEKSKFDQKKELELKLEHRAILERRLHWHDLQEKIVAERQWRRSQEEEELSYAVLDKSERGDKTAHLGEPTKSGDDNAAWYQIDQIEKERRLHGKKAKKANKEEGGKKKKGKNTDELEAFSAKFAAAK